MRNKERSIKERICALLLAVLMPLTGILPQMALTVQAEGSVQVPDQEPIPVETVDVNFTVTDGTDPLAGVTVTISNDEMEDSSLTTGDGGTCTFLQLKKGTEYTYNLTKSGYESGSGSFTAAESAPMEATMTISAIAVDQTSISAVVGDEKTIIVTNPVEGAKYTAESNDATVATVAGEGPTFEISALKEGTASITISNDKRSAAATVSITVNKKDMGDVLGIEISPSDGTGQDQMTCSLTGLPDDAEDGKITFVISSEDGASVTKEITVEKTHSGPYSVTYPDTVGGQLGGIYTVTASYTGGTKYADKTGIKTEAKFTKNVPLELTEEGKKGKTAEVGESDWEVPIDSETVLGRELSYSSSNPEVVEVYQKDKDKKWYVKAKHVTKEAVKITITAPAQNNYEETSVVYDVTVNPGKITSIENSEDWTKEITEVYGVYDTEKPFSIEGTIKVDGDKKYKVVLKATLSNENVGDDRKYTVNTNQQYTMEDAKGHKDYVLTAGFTGTEVVTTKVNITKRPVYLTVKDIEVQYGRSYSDVKAEIENKENDNVKNKVKLAGNGENGAIDDKSGYIGEDKGVLPNCTFNSTFGETAFEQLFVGMSAEHVIVPNMDPKDKEKHGDPGDNYEFKFDEDNPATVSGNLVITPQIITDEDILTYVDVNFTGTNIDIRRDENGNLSEIWVASGVTEEEPEGATITLSVKQEYQKYYNKIMVSFSENDENAINATDDGISLREYPGATQRINLSGSIWLLNSEHSATRTYKTYADGKGTANAFSIINVDNKAPTVEFKGLTNAGIIGSTLQAITFGTFSNQKTYTEQLWISETEGTDLTSSVSGSGISGWEYYVWKTGAGISDDDLTEGEEKKIKAKVDALSADDWIKGAGTEENQTITIGTGNSEEDVENNYIVFVRTKDKVGNIDVYVSNGMVIEQKQPVIQMEFSNTNKVYGGEDMGAYKGDVNYKLTVNDAGDFKSGIASVKVTVTQDGKEVAGSGEINPIDSNKKYENSYTYTPDSKSLYTYADIVESSQVVINGVVTSDGITSNNVMIMVEVQDRAGNEPVAYTQKLIIDKTSPEIKVSFDKNTPVNDKYYQDSRTMNIVYTDRNFGFLDTKDKSPVNVGKDYVWFDLRREGEEEYSQYSLEELSKVEGIQVTPVVEDSQKAVKDETGYAEGRTNTVAVTFTGQNEYSIIPHCKDKLKNEAQNPQTYDFVIDTEAPVVTDIDYRYFDTEKNQYVPYDSGEAKSATVQVSMTVKEHYFYEKDNAENFIDGQIKLETTAENTAAGDETDYQKKYQDEMNLKKNWSTAVEQSGTDKYKITLTFNNDANYKMKLSYTDLAGRNVQTEEQRFTVDKTRPTGKVTINENFWTELFDIITFGIFDKNQMNGTLEGADVTSGVQSISYYRYYPDAESRNDFEGLSGKQLDTVSEENWKAETSFAIPFNEQAVIYERVIDWAGNITYLNSNGVISDNTSPDEPQIRITAAEPAQGIYNSNVPFHISVTDPLVGNTYAGLESVYYEVRKDGAVTQSGNYDDALKPKTSRVQNIERDEVIDAAANNSNNVQIYVKAVDNAGNTVEATKDVKIDITIPTIQVTYDLNSPSNGKYYNATRTATVTVTERNFDENAVRFNITNTDGTQPSISGWSRSADAGVSDQAVNTCTVAFAADGDYTFTLNCTDLAGNDSNYTQTDEFTIDKTVPVINVGFDNNSAANATYYNKPRTATITVNEHNFNGSEVQAAISASLQSAGISAPGVNGWSTSGDTHTATVYFGTDGDYSFTVNYTDLAGNAAVAYTQEKFTVDQTKPEIEIFDIKDKSANNSTVAPGVKYSDVNYDSSGVKLILKGPKHSEQTVDGTRSSIVNGESIKMADFARKQEIDDVYTLTAQVTDRAGNVDEKAVTFSVNRFGSNFVFGKSTQEFLDKYYANEEQDLVVTEVNVDTLVHNGISYGLDGELTKLAKGSDYTVKESGNEASWKSYQYTIKASNFEKEGLYNVTIDSKDRANNELNNKVKKAGIEFVIDKTAPTVVITGVEDNGRYRANNRDITIAVTDNVAVDKMDVFTDGATSAAERYDAKDIREQKGEIPFSLTSASNWQKIRVEASDAAGNKVDSSEMRVLVTANLLVQFYRNTPVLVGSSAMAAGLIAVVVFLLSKKKKEYNISRKDSHR